MPSYSHWLWFVTNCSKLKSDFRYSAESVFDTFPWPQTATVKQIDAAIDGFTTDTNGLRIPTCERRAFAEFQRSLLMLRSATQEIRSALDGQDSQWAASNASLQEAAWHNDRSTTLHTIDCG